MLVPGVAVAVLAGVFSGVFLAVSTWWSGFFDLCSFVRAWRLGSGFHRFFLLLLFLRFVSFGNVHVFIYSLRVLSLFTEWCGLPGATFWVVRPAFCDLVSYGGGRPLNSRRPRCLCFRRVSSGGVSPRRCLVAILSHLAPRFSCCCSLRSAVYLVAARWLFLFPSYRC